MQYGYHYNIFICILRILDANFEQLSESNGEYNQSLAIPVNEVHMFTSSASTEGVLIILVGYKCTTVYHIFRPMYTYQ